MNTLQGNKDWLEFRCGKINASEAGVLMSYGTQFDIKEDTDPSLLVWGEEIEVKLKTKTKKCFRPYFSDGGITLLETIVAERMGSRRKEINCSAVRWGKENEPYAIEAYIEETGFCVEEVGSIPHEKYPFICGSPDGVIIEHDVAIGGIEIKCPESIQNHIKYARSFDYIKTKHYHQIQQNMCINKTDWCDFISYDPRHEALPIFIERFHRDEKYIQEMEYKLVLANQIAEEMYNDIIHPNVEF